MELSFSVNYGHFSLPKKVREKLRRFVHNYGEMCGNLFITQGPGLEFSERKIYRSLFFNRWQTEYSAMHRVGTSHDFILSTDAVNVGIGKSLSIAQEKKMKMRKTLVSKKMVENKNRQIRED